MSKPLIHLVIAGVLLVAALGAYIGWYLVVSAAKNDAATATASVAAIEKQDAAVAAAKDELALVVADEEAVRAYVLAPEDIVGFLEGLEATGKSLGSVVEVASVDPDPNGTITVAIHLSGPFGAVMRTLGAIEYAPRDIRLKSLTLDTAPSQDVPAWSAAATFVVASTPAAPAQP
jgi:hypothetical protein